MTAEQVLRAAIVKVLFGFTYRNLAFHIVDSQSIRRFCRIGIADKGFKKSVLNRNIKALSEQTWQAINRELIGYAKDQNIEKGRQVRIDCTVVESNIHKPFDSTLLWDSVRVLTRLLHKAKDDYGLRKLNFHDHTRRAKKRMLAIDNAKNEKQRNRNYKDLLKISRKCIDYAHSAIELIQSSIAGTGAMLLCFDLKQYVKLSQQVVDQTERRIIHDEKVPASEKIFSLFEPHTDIIIKDRREKSYGHKVCLTGGGSNLIIDFQITKGNPADSTLTETMLERQKEIYNQYPLKVALDGGFASKENLKIAIAGIIEPKVIDNGWIDMMWVIASIVEGVAPPSLIAQHLSKSPKHPATKGFNELGKILRSSYMLQFGTDMSLRRLVMRYVARRENWNTFSRDIFNTGFGGLLREKSTQSQEEVFWCLTVVQNAIALWNALAMELETPI